MIVYDFEFSTCCVRVRFEIIDGKEIAEQRVRKKIIRKRRKHTAA